MSIVDHVVGKEPGVSTKHREYHGAVLYSHALPSQVDADAKGYLLHLDEKQADVQNISF